MSGPAEPTAGTQPQPAHDTALTAAGVLVGLIVPGGGHLLLGQTFKAALFATALLATIAFGLYKGQYANFTTQAQERHPVMYVLQFFTGGPAVVAYLNTPETTEQSSVFHNPKGFEVAVLFTAVAGLLNLLVLFDLIGLPSRVRELRAAAQARAADAPSALGGRAARSVSPPSEAAAAASPPPPASSQPAAAPIPDEGQKD